ncbi:MAG: hypothetical protein M3N13_10085, partial [Candidatus Eremiobacteraeota bacterium]|nr:hypothetical protein [Candidatus Eremiobacteraeota bacterium]
PAYKVSTCAEGRLDEPMLECRRDQYGRTWYCDGRYADEAGWDDWFPSQLHTQAALSINSPVTATTRALIVRLPDDMSSQEFDRLIDAEIRKAALDLWVMTPEGHRHCSFLGVDPSVALRMTPYPYGAHSRNSPARELCAFRIHHDPDRLVALAELIILRHLGLIP